MARAEAGRQQLYRDHPAAARLRPSRDAGDRLAPAQPGGRGRPLAVIGLSALALVFHGGNGHRRSATELCAHLASHGYVVASPDFVGNTHADRLAALASGLGSADPHLHSMETSATHRPLDARLVLERMLAGASGLRLDGERVGCLGISFGGWTALALNSIDPRPRASLALAPAWGQSGELAGLAALLRTDDWKRPVPTLLVAAERDVIVPLADLRELQRRLPAPKRFALLHGAGHIHFGDDPEARHEAVREMLTSAASLLTAERGAEMVAAMGPFSALCPAAHGTDTARALALAHLDAHVRESSAAAEFLAGDLAQVFAARRIGLATE